MLRADTPAAVQAYERWNGAILDQADHRIGCELGCSIMGDVCELGLGYARAEQRAWAAYYNARYVTHEVTA